MVTTTTADLRGLVAAVPDPELPMITIAELGVLRDVRVETDGHVIVDITPTYSGCPAMDAIQADVRARLAAAGYEDVEVRLVLAPAWTTDWITETGRAVLRRHGIAPPHPAGRPVALRLSVRCPRCGSPEIRELSRFGSTACKALWRCEVCLEPFDHVKAL
jgi:ring-1,2-phenylacetyl-CoA epoxidase subunit PaaD